MATQEAPRAASDKARWITGAIILVDGGSKLSEGNQESWKLSPIGEAAQAPIVLIAIPWPKVDEVLKSLPDKWENRILIDATNHFLLPSMEIADLKGQVSSEIVQGLVPGARVVKALNNLRMSKFEAGPRVGQSRRIAFVSGNDSNAKQEVGSLIREFGFAVIDLGSLHDGGRMQQLEGPLAGLDLAQIDD
jgi:predicted dinucleotide-binding enzyme